MPELQLMTYFLGAGFVLYLLAFGAAKIAALFGWSIKESSGEK